MLLLLSLIFSSTPFPGIKEIVRETAVQKQYGPYSTFSLLELAAAEKGLLCRLCPSLSFLLGFSLGLFVDVHTGLDSQPVVLQLEVRIPSVPSVM